MSIQNIDFCEEIIKIIFQLLSNTHYLRSGAYSYLIKAKKVDNKMKSTKFQKNSQLKLYYVEKSETRRPIL